jgi:hypothetical protein
MLFKLRRDTNSAKHPHFYAVPWDVKSQRLHVLYGRLYAGKSENAAVLDKY